MSILVLAGSPKEIVDGVRYFANHARPENLGQEAAKLLTAQGEKVTLIAPNDSIISARDLLKIAENTEIRNIKAVVQLANIASIRPAQVSAQKLKIKKETGHLLPMEVVGNVDIWKRLEDAFPGIPIIGYRHNNLTSSISNALVNGLKPLIEEAWRQAGNFPSWPESQRDSKAIQPLPQDWITLESPSDSGDDELLTGRKIIVTSGPTAERLTTQGDVITNFSTGKQGLAIAQALESMGAQVTLITGGTAHDMLDKVLAALPADAYIGVAAVADFAVENPLNLHLKEDEPYTLQLAQNPDILQTIGQHPTLRPKIVIGFAAETDRENLLQYARSKLTRKGADAICANHAAVAGGDKNHITWITRAGAEPWNLMDKRAVGWAIGLKLAQMLDSWRNTD